MPHPLFGTFVNKLDSLSTLWHNFCWKAHELPVHTQGRQRTQVPRRPITAAGGCFVLYGFLLPLVFLTGCGGVNPTTSGSGGIGQDLNLDWGSISGRVTASGGVPLSQAYIETVTKQTTSGSDGAYLLGPMPPGDYRVIARASGLQPQVKEGVRVRAGLITERVDFLLTQGSATATPDFAVLAVSPRFGTDGDMVTVIGTGFGSRPGRVTVAGKDATVIDWNSGLDGRIIVRLPAEVETGAVKVIIAGVSSHETQEVTLIARPVLLEAVPVSARPGASLTLYGRNFSVVPAFNRVSLNGRACQVIAVDSPRQMTVLMPQGAETGILQIRLVTNEFQLEGLSTVRVTVPPELIHLSPKRSLPGVTLTLSGRHFTTDTSAVKVLLGERATLQGNDILTFSNTRLTFLAPGTDVVPAGESVEIRLSVNGIPTQESFVWTSYNPDLTTLDAYGIYEFEAVSRNGTLHLPKLGPDDRIAFVSVISGSPNLDLGGDFTYSLTSVLGNNRVLVPTLPTTALGPRAALATRGTYRDVGPLLRRLFPRSGGSAVRPALAADGLRPAIANPAPASATFWLANFATGDPGNPADDQLATATLMATGTYCLVYVDTATDTRVTASDAEKVAARFDAIYPTLATACWDGSSTPPEGDIDGQPRILLLLTPQINRGATGNLVILGYFNPRDKDPTRAHSAGTEILYLWDDAFLTNPDDFSGILAHELQHMMYYNQKGSEGVEWIDEGLSVWAQQIAGYGFTQGMPTPVSYVVEYLRAPHKVSLNHWPDDPGLENYGMSYLFVEYLFERCAGYEAIRRLEKKNGAIGFDDIQTHVLPLAQPTTPNLETFFHDFCLALYLDNLGLPDTFSGNQPAAWSFPQVDLRTTYAGVAGLRHLTFDENPVLTTGFTMKGFGADVIEYRGGNGGDLEFTRLTSPAAAGYKLFVLYYPATR